MEDTSGVSMGPPPSKDEEYNSDYIGNIESDPQFRFDQLLVEWTDLLFQELDHDGDNSWTQSKVLILFELDINNLHSHLLTMNNKIVTCLWGNIKCFSSLPKMIWYEYVLSYFSIKGKQSIGHCHLIQWKNIASLNDGRNYILKTTAYNSNINVQRTTRFCQKFCRSLIRVYQEDKYTHHWDNDHLFRCSHIFYIDSKKGQSDIIPIQSNPI